MKFSELSVAAVLLLSATAAHAQDVAYAFAKTPTPAAPASLLAPAKVAEPTAVTRLLPVFDGGTAALEAAIADRLEYPAVAQANGVEGVVVVRVRIDAAGVVSRVEIVEGVSPECDAAAAAAVASLPAFAPALLDGRPFARNVRVAARFSL